MKPIVETRSTSSSSIESVQMGISKENVAAILGILRSGLYTDKIGAVLREYGANAWDANRMVGRGDLPIEIHIPTSHDPVLRIRDNGPGLSKSDVLNVFSQYGASTKRDSNSSVGMLGIGCLLKGQPIVTNTGVKPIEDIKVGDWVLTHKGRFRQVTDLMRRPYSGKAHKIWLSQTKVPLILTEEHPVLVANSSGETSWMLPGEIQTGRKPARHKNTDAWQSYAVLPATVETTVTTVDVVDVLGEKYSHVEGVLTREQPYTHNENGQSWDRVRTTRWEGFPSALTIDEDLGWAFGLFAAEGSTSSNSGTSDDKKRITISLNISEEAFAQRFASIVASKFGIEMTWNRRPEKSILELYTDCVPLATLFRNLMGGGAHDKHVPSAIFQGTDKGRRGFLRGVLDGDGSGTRSRFIFGVCSSELAWGVRNLMMVVDDKWGTVGYMPKYERWSVNYNREPRQSYSKRVGDYLMRPISKIEEFELESEVFNFSVDEDESYVSDFVLHNCKSGFCYSDAFTVISWPGDGTRLTYSVFLDETEMGQMNLMDESPSDEPTGVQIEITARQGDLYEFTQKAQKLFQHYEPRPNINITLPALPDKRVALTHGTIQDAGGWSSSWFAIMGCVPYRVDLEQLDQTLIAKCLPRLSGSVRFEIGDVAIASNREELQYSTKTKATLVQKLNDLVDEYVIHALEKLEGMTGWDKRLKLKVLEEMGLDLPSEYEEMMDTYASVKYEPGVAGFTILHNDSVCTRITVSSKTKFVIKDTEHPLKHYPYVNHHYYIVKGPGTPEDLKKKLEEALKASNLDGVPVGLLSAEHYQKPWEKPKKAVNPKHRAKMFRLNIGKSAHNTNSENWEVVDRVPEDADVIVILKAFEPEIRDFWLTVVQLKTFCAQSGETMPEIYGYKSTEKKPVLATDCKGVEFSAWYRDTIAKWTVKYADKLQDYWWTYPAERLQDPGAHGRKWLAEQLGEDHVISDFFKKFTKGDRTTLSAFQFLADQSYTWKTSAAKVTTDRFFQQYPLLKNDVSDLWDSYSYGNKATRENWVAYVKQTDELNLLRSALASDDLDPCI